MPSCLDLQPYASRLGDQVAKLNRERRKKPRLSSPSGCWSPPRVVGQLAAAQLRRADVPVKLVREETNINMTLNFDFVLRAVDSLYCRLPVACLSTHLCSVNPSRPDLRRATGRPQAAPFED